MRKERAVVSGVAITSPERLVYERPRITKKQVAEYYAAAAKRMSRYVFGRVLSVIRCHGSAGKACFFKKHPQGAGKGIKTVIVTSSDEGGKAEYFYIEKSVGLISEVQLGTVEFHVWASRADAPEHPDTMVFDLDPDEGMRLDRVRRGVKDLKAALDALGLKSFLKTSGGKGYHVVVPFEQGADWSAFREFAKGVAALMEYKFPERYTANARKVRRKGKIFIDWMRNVKGATSVAPYSLRARDGAPVSAPISWRELDKIAPDGIDIYMAAERLKKPDPWKDFGKVKQKLS